jgi:antirestriction protein ArdC
MTKTCPKSRRPLKSPKLKRRRRPTKRKFNSVTPDDGSGEVRQDVYERITARIVEQLEQGVKPWQQSWSGGGFHRPMRFNGQPYAGINVLMLWMTAKERGYDGHIWMTFRQAEELGAHVRKGERGTLVVYANRFTKTETNDHGEEVEREIPFLKGYTVFCSDQIEGLPEHYYAKPPPCFSTPVQRIEHAEAFFAATGITIRQQGHRAFYREDTDVVQVPPIDRFPDAEEFYSTLAHESIHATKHATRLARSFGESRFGNEAYAVEELVAELGAAFLCADLELARGEPDGVREDHAAYMASWLKVLKGDKRVIFTAASHAQKAAGYLHSLQPNAHHPEPEEQPDGPV